MKIIVTSGSFAKYSPQAINELSKRFEIEHRKILRDATDEEIAEELKDADAVIIGGSAGSGRINRKIMELTPKLKLIAKHGLGLDNLDIKAATEKGIAIINCRHTMQERTVAEHTMALILSTVRKVVEADNYVKRGKWKERSELIGLELYGKTLGVIGFGSIGRIVAKIAKEGFEMNVMAYDPYVPEKLFRDLNVKSTELSDLLRKSDVITIHVPLTDETRNLIDYDEFKMMKKETVLVNASRGEVINEEALLEAVKNGRITSVALDVMVNEPPDDDNELLKMRNVTITPHLGSYTIDANIRMAAALTEDISKYFNGEKPLRIVNPEVFENP